MMDTNIFDKYVDFYDKKKPYSHDYYFINIIKKTKKQVSNLVDIGGGSGTFARLAKANCIDIDVTVVDPSKKLLNKINDGDIKKIYGKLPGQIFLDSSFDYIHVKEVFHHIVGSSINESKKLLRDSLFTIKEFMNDDGFLLIHELFYESYLIPTLSRTLIFYLLTLQNILGIKVPTEEFLLDLKVCFYTISEFKSILNDCGFKIVDSYQEYWGTSSKKRILFLKNWGRILFVVRNGV